MTDALRDAELFSRALIAISQGAGEPRLWPSTRRPATHCRSPCSKWWIRLLRSGGPTPTLAISCATFFVHGGRSRIVICSRRPQPEPSKRGTSGMTTDMGRRRLPGESIVDRHPRQSVSAAQWALSHAGYSMWQLASRKPRGATADPSSRRGRAMTVTEARAIAALVPDGRPRPRAADAADPTGVRPGHCWGRPGRANGGRLRRLRGATNRRAGTRGAGRAGGVERPHRELSRVPRGH